MTLFKLNEIARTRGLFYFAPDREEVGLKVGYVMMGKDGRVVLFHALDMNQTIARLGAKWRDGFGEAVEVLWSCLPR